MGVGSSPGLHRGTVRRQSPVCGGLGRTLWNAVAAEPAVEPAVEQGVRLAVVLLVVIDAAVPVHAVPVRAVPDCQCSVRQADGLPVVVHRHR